MISPNKESKYYPEDKSRIGRLKREAGVIPIKENKVSGSGLVSAQQKEKDLIADSKHLGLGHPPANVLYELRQKTELDRALTRGMSYKDRARKAAVVYDHMNGTKEAERHLPTLKTEAEAKYWYHNLREHMFVNYKAWRRLLDHRADGVIEGKTPPVVNAPLTTPGKIITPPLVKP